MIDELSLKEEKKTFVFVYQERMQNQRDTTLGGGVYRNTRGRKRKEKANCK